MTDEILQTDIDLARRLIAEGHPDAEIVENLAFRKIAPNRASRLVAELRGGKTVEPDQDWRAAATRNQLLSRRVPSPGPRIQQPASAPPRRTDPIVIPWGRIIAVVSVMVCIAVVIWIGQHKRRVSTESGTKVAAALGGSPPEPGSLEIEIDPGGVQIQGSRVRSDNVLAVFSSVLGPPSRTNHLAADHGSVYVFDAYGIVIYPAKEDNRDSIVIDFEGNGGTNSASAAFSGKLKIADAMVTADIGPKELAAWKEPRIDENGASSGIYNLRYKSLHLIFAYLTRPDHLSLAEIDFDEGWGNALH
jgi:hypothetical protein